MGRLINSAILPFLLAVPMMEPYFQDGKPEVPPSSSPVEAALLLSERRAEYDTAIRGLKERFPIRMEIHDLQGQTDPASRLLPVLEDQPPDLIIAFGASAYQWVKSRDWEVPVMFSMVAYPERYTKEGEMPFGIALQLDPFVEMKFIRDLCGKDARVGMIYNPEISKTLVERREKSAKMHGVRVVALPAANEKGSLEAVDRLKEEVDVFFLIPDPAMVGAKILERLKLECFRRGKPIIGFSEKCLSEECLAFIGPDFEALGRLTGEKAAFLLKSDVASGIIYPTEYVIGINDKVAERLGFRIPKAVLRMMKRAAGEEEE